MANQPRVYNKYHNDAPHDAVYIGRPSIFGNPYTLRDFSRTDAVQLYEKWLMKHPELINVIKQELRGKDLVCFCKPHACHGDILLRIANED